tara:strand:- start:1346 stop:1456 length:111 start_codon:yes stop_codon:yes gene_type:complete
MDNTDITTTTVMTLLERIAEALERLATSKEKEMARG